MSRLLNSGLILGGIGVVAAVIVPITGGFGPCGTASPVGFLALIAAVLCVPAGLLLLLAAGIAGAVRYYRQLPK